MTPTTDSRTRRRALAAIGAVLAGVSLGTTASARGSDGAASSESPGSDASGRGPATGTQAAGNQPGEHTERQPGEHTERATRRYEWYEGTVDRIVDDRHVVLLLEADGRVVDQVVVDRAELPDVDERDRLLVLVDGEEIAAAVRL